MVTGSGVTGEGASPGGESPESVLIRWVWALLTACPLTWAQVRGWSVPAVCCDTPSAAPPGPLRSLWAAEVRTRLWAMRGTPPGTPVSVPIPPPTCHPLLAGARAFSSTSPHLPN